MALEQTLCIIKPDAVRRNFIDRINDRIEAAGLRIVTGRMVQMNRAQAEDFYAVHRGRSFYEPLISFMISGPVLVQVLEGENAIDAYRKLIGTTNPMQAAPGTLRAEFAGAHHGGALHENALHGSDRTENASHEIDFFFPQRKTRAS